MHNYTGAGGDCRPLFYIVIVMQKHEEKVCPRCQQAFECKVGSVSLCQCSHVAVSEDERKYLQQCFGDCLCAGCIQALKADFHRKRFDEAMKRLMRQ